MTLDITCTDMFCGAGGSTCGAVLAGVDVQLAINHSARVIETYNTNYPKTKHIQTDLQATSARKFPRTDILIASPECFPSGTLILTKKGIIPIEEVQEGDEVFTHLNRWRVVTQAMSRDNAETIIIRGRGHYGLEVTKEHPIWARHCTYPWDNTIRRSVRHLGDPSWVNAQELHNHFWALPTVFGDEVFPVPDVPGRGAVFTTDFWWMVGRWLGDGSLRLRFNKKSSEKSERRPHRSMPALCEVCSQPALPHRQYPHLATFYCSDRCKNRADAVSNDSRGSSVQICCGHKEAESLEEHLNFAPPKNSRAVKGEYRWSRREIRTATVFDCPHNGLAAWLLKHFGQHADGKHLPTWVLTMPIEWRQALLDGYVSADGYKYRDGFCISTVSRRLAFGILFLSSSLGFQPMMNVSTRLRYSIEGREGPMRAAYGVRWGTDLKRAYAETTDTHVWGRIKEISPG